MGTEYTKQGTCSIDLFFKYIFSPTDFTGSKINNPGTSSVMLSSPEWVARSNGMSLWAGRCKQTKRGEDEVEEEEAERAGCSDGIVFILVHGRITTWRNTCMPTYAFTHVRKGSTRDDVYFKTLLNWPECYKIKRQSEQRWIKIGHIQRFLSRGGGRSGIRTGGLKERRDTINITRISFLLLLFLIMDRLLCLCSFACITRWWTADSHPTHTVFLFQFKKRKARGSRSFGAYINNFCLLK